MPIVTDGPMLEPENKGIDQFHVGMGTSLGATVSETLSDLPVAQLYRLNTPTNDSESVPSLPQSDPLGNAIPSDGPAITEEVKPAVQRVDMIEAIDRVKKAGLAPHLTLPDQPDISPAQLDIMIQRARERREREVTMERGPQGFIPSTLAVGTSFLVGAIDPINLASAFVPVMGEMRYGKMLATAGEGLANRLAVRASVGAAEGAVGQAALEPLDWWSHTQDGRDFGMADVLHNVMFGAVLGGALHGTGGAVSDAWRRRAGKPVYPFGPGEIMDGMQGGTHLPSRLLSEDGITPDALEQHFNGEAPNPRIVDQTPEASTPIFHETPDQPVTPAMLSEEVAAARPLEPSAPIQIIDDLPPRAKEDAMRAGIASLIDGEPLRVGEMLEAAAQTDPRIAESFEAWHGSPHDFDRFDTTRIGTGEGVQAFGDGLYFAESEKVARNYRRTTSEKVFIDKVAELYDQDFSPNDAWAEIKDNWKDFSPQEQALMTALHADDWFGFDYPHQAVSAALGDVSRYDPSPESVAAARAMGNMYKVKIKTDRAQFLDWDKPLSEQPESVKRAVEAKIGFLPEDADKILGRDIVRDWITEGQLREAGIPGIKYFDGASRKEGSGTQNFVVFDDKHIEITHKNGDPVSREEFLAEREAARADKPVAAKAARGRAAADPQTWSLNEFLANEGGLKPDPELEAIFGTSKGPFVPGFGSLVRPTGRTLDDALRLAKDNGYMFDAADVTGAEASLTPRDLLDRLAHENAGRKQYRMDQSPESKVDLEREKHEIITALHDEIEASTGIKGTKVDPSLEDRVVQMVTKEGERDVLAAYERAIMEDRDRWEGLDNVRKADQATGHIEGWDPVDAGAAPGAGAADAGQRGQTGLPAEGPRRADGGQSRGDGSGNRAPVANALDRDASWRALAHATPEFDSPDIVAASKAADKVQTPKTGLSERVTASEKADAYAKQMYDMFAHRIPEEDRQRLDDLIKRIDDDNEAREIAIVRGGSCLFGVV